MQYSAGMNNKRSNIVFLAQVECQLHDSHFLLGGNLNSCPIQVVFREADVVVSLSVDKPFPDLLTWAVPYLSGIVPKHFGQFAWWNNLTQANWKNYP
jgi:hypothetical protein